MGGGACAIRSAPPLVRAHESTPNPRNAQVQFLKGTLRPDDGQDLEAWRKVVGVKDAKDDEKKGSMARLRESATKLLLKVGGCFVADGGHRLTRAREWRSRLPACLCSSLLHSVPL